MKYSFDHLFATVALVLLGLVGLSGIPGAAPAPVPATLLAWHPACMLRNARAIDGDTIHADVILPYGIVLEAQTIRASDYDAWESRRIRRTVGPITDDELSKGKAARIALQRLIDTTTLSLEAPASPKEFRDNYGRLLGRLHSDGHPLGPWMRREGHCRPEPLKMESEEVEAEAVPEIQP